MNSTQPLNFELLLLGITPFHECFMLSCNSLRCGYKLKVTVRLITFTFQSKHDLGFIRALDQIIDVTLSLVSSLSLKLRIKSDLSLYSVSRKKLAPKSVSSLSP